MAGTDVARLKAEAMREERARMDAELRRAREDEMQRDSEMDARVRNLRARLEEARSAIAKQSPSTRANLAGRFKVG